MGLLDEELFDAKNIKEKETVIPKEKGPNIGFDGILEEILPPKDIGEFFDRQKIEKIPAIINNRINFLTTNTRELNEGILNNFLAIDKQILLFRDRFIPSSKPNFHDDILVEDLSHDEFLSEYKNFKTIPELLYFSSIVKNRKNILVDNFSERTEDIDKITKLSEELTIFVNVLLEINKYVKFYKNKHN